VNRWTLTKEKGAVNWVSLLVDAELKTLVIDEARQSGQNQNQER